MDFFLQVTQIYVKLAKFLKGKCIIHLFFEETPCLKIDETMYKYLYGNIYTHQHFETFQKSNLVNYG